MKKKTIRLFVMLLALLLIKSLNIQAQDPEANESVLNNIVPPSPTAASLGKYGNIPVTLATGTPGISIPIWQVKSRSLTLPITLSYHASGIKVEERAGWTGLGWSLNAGGIITRSIVGKPDYGITWGIPEASELDPYDDAHFNLIELASGGQIDLQPDMFYYNFAGYTGQFVFDEDGEPYLLEYENIRIERISNQEFRVTTPDGTIYKFGTDLEGNFTCEESQQFERLSNSEKFISTWYLTEIIAPGNTDTIFFKYKDIGRVDFSHIASHQKTVSILESPLSISRNVYMVEKKNLEKIIFSNGRVQFLSDTLREDYLGTSPGKLNAIVIEDKNGLELKRFNLQYDYYNADNTSTASHFYKRLKLVGVQEVSPIGTGLPPYKVAYNDIILPSRRSMAQDHWGYYNGADDNETLIPTVGYFEGANRETVPYYTLAGIIKRITYPKGGYSEFEFESHIIYTGPVGGVRIKSIKTHDGLHPEKDFIKTYEYKNQYNTTSGYLTLNSEPKYTYDEYAVSYNPYETIGQVLVCVSTSKTLLGTTHGSHISYKRVTEYQGTIEENTGKIEYNFSFTPDNAHGFPFPPHHGKAYLRGKLLSKKDYKVTPGGYTLKKTVENTYNLNGPNMPNYKNIRGLKVACRYSGMDPYYLVQNKSKMYEWINYDIDCRWSYMDTTTIHVYDDIDSTKYLETKTIYQYDNPVHARVTRTIQHNSDGLEITTINNYPHDYNVNDPSKISGPRAKAIQHMQDKNIANEPIEQQVWSKKIGETEAALVNSKFTEYREIIPILGMALIKPYKIHTIEEKSRLHNFTPAIPVTGSDSIKIEIDPRYRLNTTFKNYDHYGNLLQFEEKGINTSFLWGYSGAFPIAAATNTEISSGNIGNSFSYIGFESGKETQNNPDENYWDFNPLNDHSLAGESFTGQYSRIINPGIAGITRNFTPDNQEQQFIFSAWVKTSSGFVNGQGNLSVYTLSTNPGSTTIYPAVSGSLVEASFSDTNGEWQYVEAILNLQQVRELGNISNSEKLMISCEVFNNDATHNYSIDEVRFMPYNSDVTTYSYSPLEGITSVTDKNSLPTYYEYGKFGRLERVKDYEKNIVKRIKYSEVFVDLDYEHEGTCGTYYILPNAGVQGTEISFTVRDEQGAYLDIVNNKVTPDGKNFTVTCLVSELENTSNTISQSFDVAVNHNVTGDVQAHELSHNLEIEFDAHDFCVCDNVDLTSHQWEIGRPEDFNAGNFEETGITTCKYEFEQDGTYDVSYKFTDQFGKIHKITKSFTVSASGAPVGGDGGTVSNDPLGSVDIKIDGMFIDDRDREYSTSAGSINFDAIVTGGSHCNFAWFVKTTGSWIALSGTNGQISISDSDGYNDFNIKVVVTEDGISVEKEKTLILKFL